jgi:archaellum biogenesis ATPase FlaH
MQKLYQSPPVKGQRHLSMLRMVSAFKRSGVPQSGIENMMKSWVGNEMEIAEIHKIVSDVFQKNYAFSCQDEVMSRHCDSRCMFFQKKSYNATVPRDTLMMEEGFRKFVTFDAGKFLELSDFFDLKNAFSIYPQEFVVLEGDTGLGKSSLIQNINIHDKTFKTLYLNFEVGERVMYRRFLQIAHGKTKYDIMSHYANPDAPTLSKEVEHIHMVSDRITLHILEQLLAIRQYDIVVADTLECFTTPGISEITPKTELIAHELKRLAIKYNTIVLAVHHVSKASVLDPQGKRKDLNVHAGKGSSAVEQEADKIILLEGQQTSGIRRIRSAKARDESPFDTHMTFDAERTFRYFKESKWQPLENSSEPFAPTPSASSETPVLTSPGAGAGGASPSSGALRHLP